MAAAAEGGRLQSAWARAYMAGTLWLLRSVVIPWAAMLTVVEIEAGDASLPSLANLYSSMGQPSEYLTGVDPQIDP